MVAMSDLLNEGLASAVGRTRIQGALVVDVATGGYGTRPEHVDGARPDDALNLLADGSLEDVDAATDVDVDCARNVAFGGTGNDGGQVNDARDAVLVDCLAQQITVAYVAHDGVDLPPALLANDVLGVVQVGRTHPTRSPPKEAVEDHVFPSQHKVADYVSADEADSCHEYGHCGTS